MFETDAIKSGIYSQESTNSFGKVDMAKNDFLKLLIAQLSNQDPMSPLESQDFAAQLAQFSSVEQLQNINSNIEQGIEVDLILAQTINNTMAASLIGKYAKAIGDTVVIDAYGGADLTFRLNGFAQDVKITITDSNGNTVNVLTVENLSNGEHNISWDGKNTEGQTVQEGTYHFTVEATDIGGNVISVTPLIVGNAAGIKYENGKSFLLIGGQEVPFSSVVEIGMASNG